MMVKTGLYPYPLSNLNFTRQLSELLCLRAKQGESDAYLKQHVLEIP